MGGFNNHLSVPPSLIPDDGVELFGTAVNTKMNYCSPFPIEKDFFSSKGSFFKYELSNGFHIANPPFDETIMGAMAKRLDDQLSKQITADVVIIIPKWEKLEAFDTLLKSPFFVKYRAWH